MKKIVTIVTAIALFVLTSAYLLIKKNSEVKSTPTTIQGVLGENIASSPTPIATPISTEVPQTLFKGYGEINEDGTNTTFIMDIPVSGGKVTGTISGYCEGSLEGVFDPRTNFTQGTVKGSCSKIPATGRFEGKVNLESKMGSGVYNGNSVAFTKSGSWSLVVKP